MNLKNKLYFAVDFIQCNKKKYYVEMILLFLCFCLFSTGCFLKAVMKKYRYEIEMTMDGSTKNVGKIINYNYKYSTEELYEGLHNIEGVEAVSADRTDTFFSNDIIKEMQKKYGNTENNFGFDSGKSVTVQPDVLKIFNIELEDGRVWTYDEMEEIWNDTKHYEKLKDAISGEYKDYGFNTWYGIYLGDDYNDIPVGTRFINHGDEHDTTYEVLGHIKKDSLMIDTLYLYVDEAEYAEAPVVNLNSYVMYCAEIKDMEMLFKIKNGYSFNEVESNIKEKFDVGVICIDDILSESEKKTNINGNPYIKIAFLLCIIAVCSIFCFEIIAIENNKKNYGIFLANGMEVKDIVVITIFENILKLLLCILIGILLCRFFIAKEYGNNYDSYRLMKYIYNKYVMYESVFIMAIILAVGTAIPLFMISRYKMADLIRSEE